MSKKGTPLPSIEIKRHSLETPWTYSDLDLHQRQIAEQVRQGKPGVFILSELAPVVTFGKRSAQTDLQISPSEFQKRNIQLYPTDRGGLMTYHGPGQWVLFPVEQLEILSDGDPKGVRKVIDRLLSIACGVADECGYPIEIRGETELGVWLSQTDRKIASVGIHVEQGVVLHGLSINGYCTTESFWGIHPCGLKNAEPGFLFKDSSHFEQLGNRIIAHTQRAFT